MTDDSLTADQVIQRLLERLGASRRRQTVDHCLAGDPTGQVHGVATTMLASLPVLERAAQSGMDLVISHEAIFYDHQDQARERLAAERDPVFRAKEEFIKQNGMVVWHLHDIMHDCRPDLVDAATIEAMNWHEPESSAYPLVCPIPVQSLASLADAVARQLAASSVRFIGDRQLPVRRVGLALGFRGFEPIRQLLLRDDVDVVLAGEIHEW
ncbi:MAG: Nif3-like dinuclear metal center hexameric protein, partial [Propionibacteriaceae bacterium]|nr:Nif3-like dinuclear metal center hexameric protein [Propionibacteriaceae bacterium]